MLRKDERVGFLQLSFFVTNMQGDVIALCDNTHAPRLFYHYDAWGKLLSVTNTNGDDVTNATNAASWNSLRYRGYVYDKETGLYYLNSRYYDPETGRFISADGTVSTGQGLIGTNMYAYCGNNPVVFYDSTGRSFLVAIGLGLVVTGVLTLCTSSSAMPPAAVEVPDWDCNIVFNQPTVGEPNSKREWHDDDGNLTKERWYGPDGRVIKDRHYNNHGNPKRHPDVPHDHDWGYDKDGNWAPGKGYPTPKKSPSHAPIVSDILGVGATAALGYGIYVGAKWVIAAILATPTGGGSLVVASLAP